MRVGSSIIYKIILCYICRINSRLCGKEIVNDFSEDELLEHISKFGSLEGILGEKVSSLLEKQAK
jgi:hypothetical protein